MVYFGSLMHSSLYASPSTAQLHRPSRNRFAARFITQVLALTNEL